LKNTFKKITTEKPVNNKNQKPKKVSKVARSFKDLINGNVLVKDYVVDNIPYFAFLTFLMLCYIALGYNTDKTLKKIEQSEMRVLQLNEEYITTKTEFNLASRQSQIADSVNKLDLFEMKDEQPQVIKVSKLTMKKIY
jgi:hypothetical protein